MTSFEFKLLAVCCKILFVGYGLVKHILGGYARGLVVFGTAVCIRLL